MLDYEVKVKIDELKEKFENLKNLFNIEKTTARISELENKMTDPDFWNDQKKAEKISRELQHLKHEMEEFNNLSSLFDDLAVAIEFGEEDPSMKEQAMEILGEIEKKVKDFELAMLLSGKYDSNNVYLTIHPGAGGTESQDWADMLLRMYTRWAEKNNYKLEIIDYLPGDEAGIKSVTVKISGPFAYGKLKYESGVHRLVRVSPFDAANRRHTSFASVSVTPEIDEEIDIEIRPDDLKIDTYRAGGAGGQHVNKTDSAVRITHLPTGIVVACQNERSQHQNKATAMQILKARLYELEMQKKMEEKMKLMGDVKDISWGNQIRSYVLYPYKMVKDHRTNYETSNSDAVLDGELDGFIEAELLYFAQLNKE
ncbi:peptide chain release factor 2 [Marinitoga piezophila KA3]|uniref:Peptide chain release factor 2 n=1 Tax=Marinitoga piezophila (strain DSM 14283 / JCM 11233 / KA3) TaxID=443254 RepID=H2J3R8_MARPK|nr:MULTISPECIES: peptide chain release factor 2 [Marinitoga]AEX85810.1 peptide chain release factor 2 [Marinitoga piezophila KA3]APT76250.1 peptide chain release factor 2 [Marinitoga sp. 1137]